MYLRRLRHLFQIIKKKERKRKRKKKKCIYFFNDLIVIAEGR
jgi:hypothetical protein